MSTETISAGRAQIARRTLRNDRWWIAPAITAAVLLAFGVYATWRAFMNKYYVAGSLVSPLYSPCLAANCQPGSGELDLIGNWWKLSPALLILPFPLGFRLTCYYYRKAYYRGFWLSPPACGVAEPHKKYTGESRFPLILQNLHRYFFYLLLLFNFVLTIDAILAFRNDEGEWGHASLGTLILVANAALLWLYSLSCHSCRHALGGRLNHFSKHPVRYWVWTQVSRLNVRHTLWAWASLFSVALADAYVFAVSSGTLSDLSFF